MIEAPKEVTTLLDLPDYETMGGESVVTFTVAHSDEVLERLTEEAEGEE